MKLRFAGPGGRLEREFLDPELDLSQCVISEDERSLFVRSKIGTVRILLALLPGIPCVWFLYVLVNAGDSSPVLLAAAAIFSPFMALATGLFLFATSGKGFYRTTRTARLTFHLLGYEREKTLSIPDSGRVRLWSEWGDEDGPALWFHVQVEDRAELGFCVAWRYDLAQSFAQRLASFLSYEVLNLVRDDHRSSDKRKRVRR